MLLSLSSILIGYEVSQGDVCCKKRWSVSFAFITSGISGAALCICFMVVDILDKKVVKETLIKPFLWFGMNPLFIYCAMMCFDSLLAHNI
jgi:predicted acyltransferase